MAVYVGGLVVEVHPAFETGLGVVHNGAISMADAIIVLIPHRDLVVRQEALTVLVFGLSVSW